MKYEQEKEDYAQEKRDYEQKKERERLYKRRHSYDVLISRITMGLIIGLTIRYIMQCTI